MNREELVTTMKWGGAYFAINGSGWLARSSIVPAEWVDVATALLVVGGIGGGYLVLQALGVEHEGGRCRAETSDGSRCRLSRDAGSDLCHVHDRVHDVRLHSDVIAETGGFADERVRGHGDERVGEQAGERAG